MLVNHKQYGPMISLFWSNDGELHVIIKAEVQIMSTVIFYSKLYFFCNEKVTFVS